MMMPAMVAPPGAPPGPGRWLVAAGEAGIEIGDEVPAGCVPPGVAGVKAIVMIQGIECFIEWVNDSQFGLWKEKRFPLDARILRIKTRHGARSRDWMQLVDDAKEDPRLTGLCPDRGLPLSALTI